MIERRFSRRGGKGQPPEGLRLYGVADLDDPNVTELAPDTQLVRVRDLAAVVAPVPYERAAVDDESLGDYTRVIDAVYARGPIVPAPPGTIFRSAAVLERWMELHYAKLHEALGVVERRSSEGAPYDLVRMQLVS